MYRFGWLLLAIVVSVGCTESTAEKVDVEKKTPSPVAKPSKATPPAPANPEAAAPAAPVVGEMAPEIVGIDLDGVEFKLSDYRGKVVMLDFWGDW